jgi:hypothetical protein
MKQKNSFYSISYLVLLILSIFLIVGILINALPTFFWGDDFVLYTSLKSKGIFNFLKDVYLNWDGRSISLGGLVQTFLIRYTTAPITNFVWAISFLIASFFTVKISGYGSNLIPYLGVFIASLIILFKNHVFQTIYWSTGGAYSFNLLLGSFWVWIYLYKRFRKGLIFIATILVGATTQNLTLALMMIVVSDIIYEKIKSGNWHKNLIVLFILFLPGLFFISLAPGSIHRINHYSEVSFTSLNLLHKSAVLYYKAFSESIVAIAFAFAIAMLLYSKVKHQDSFYFFVKYFLASVISIAPFIILPVEVSESSRIFIYFQYFLLLAFINLFIVLFQILEKRLRTSLSKLYTLWSILNAFVILIFALSVVWINFKNGIIIQQRVKTREKIIVASPTNSDIVLPKITVQWNCFTFMHAFHDLTDSAEYFANSSAARYYNKNSIITKKDLSISVP